jgi:hypothetical protein
MPGVPEPRMLENLLALIDELPVGRFDFGKLCEYAMEISGRIQLPEPLNLPIKHGKLFLELLKRRKIRDIAGSRENGG